MRPTQEYLDKIAAKLDSLRKNDPSKGENLEGFKIPSFEQQVGLTAQHYLKNKKSSEKDSSPLFPDRNSY